MTANKNDKKDCKPAFEFIHPLLIWGVGLVMRAGEFKYGDWNFTKGHGRLRLCAAAMRHLLKIMLGEDIDEDCTNRLREQGSEDTVYHWDCVVANMNMLVYQRELGTLGDDRPQEGVHYDVEGIGYEYLESEDVEGFTYETEDVEENEDDTGDLD